MPVQQVYFDVPAKLARGIATGELIQFGGVIRDKQGHVVKHLKEVDVSLKDSVATAASKAAAAARENKGKVAIGAVAVAAAAGTGGYLLYKRNAKKQIRRLELVNHLQDSLDIYLQALVSGSLTLSVLQETLESIASVKQKLKGKKGDITLSEDLLNVLTSSIEKYTRELCVANNRKFKKVKRPLKKTQISSLDTLAAYLQMQQDIIRAAA